MKNKAQYQFFRKIAMFGAIFIFLFISIPGWVLILVVYRL